MRDVALATEIVYGTLRWQRYLDWILAPHSRRRLATLDARVRVLLRLTAYQLAFLERVPRFAAVNDAVTLARAKPGVAEFVNAVLRAFARRGKREREPAPPADPLEALATRCSFPTGSPSAGSRATARPRPRRSCAALNERPPLTIRANTLRLSREALAARLRRGGRRCRRRCAWRPRASPSRAAAIPGAGARSRRAGAWSRTRARCSMARLLEPAPATMIADVCAAPGTKTHPPRPAHGQSRPDARARSAGGSAGPRRAKRPPGSA